LDRSNPQFDALALKEFDLPVADAIVHLPNYRLQSALIRQYSKSQDFRTALTSLCQKQKNFELLVSPLNLVPQLVLTSQLKLGLFSTQIDFESLNLSVDDAVDLL
jgi:hypothetical protein